MSITSVKRTVRKADWLVRFIISLMIGGCIITTLTWVWFYSRASYYSRPDRELTHHQLSMIDDIDPQPITCPPCPDPPIVDDRLPPLPQPPPASDLHVINCTINNMETIECRKDRDEVYMPISFINTFFEVSGSIRRTGRNEYYEFQYAYAKLHPPQPVYHPGGVFLNFEKYYVEGRNKIMCVTASDGVPLAVQWNPAGYYYPISVAQYGLSHHAKGILDGNPIPKVITNGQRDTTNWKVTGSGMSIGLAEAMVGSQVRQVIGFSSQGSIFAPGPVLELNTQDQALCLDIFLEGPGGITVKMKTREGKLGYIHYNHEDKYMAVNGNHIVLGMGRRNLGRWMHLARDIFVDWMKTLIDVKLSSPLQFHEIVDITLHGNGYLDNVTVAATAHNEHLLQAADWLVRNQDEKGGWSTPVEMQTGKEISLKPGWYSAMGQGQAMSTLVRAYNLTGKRHYLDVAVRGLHLYELGSEEGGVRARFLGLLDWYEEYPTTPTSTFVLNGFIFSILGLYDVMKTVDGEGQRLAEKLWNTGVHSLKIMLGMYDSGSGTLYDLRHVINHEAPNRARWDYHTAHITLIQEMAILDGDPIFHQAAERWTEYYYGKKSTHN